MKQIARSRNWLSARLASRLAGKAAAAWADRRGVAAIEFGLFAVFLSIALANVTDVSIYIYQRMQVENATEIAAQAALKACATQLPATVNCTGWKATMQNALQSTSLGTSVSFVTGSPAEGYYCVNSSNALQYVSAVTSPKPADCTAAGTPALQPGDYIQVQTTFTYNSLFPGLSVAGTFPAPITRTSMMRLG
jgi:Flp pilus assembly protein TadG